MSFSNGEMPQMGCQQVARFLGIAAFSAVGTIVSRIEGTIVAIG